MLVVLQLDRLLLLLSSVVARHEHAESGGRSSAPEARVVRRRRRRRGRGEARTARRRQRRGRTLQSPPLLRHRRRLVLRLLSRVVEGDGRRTRRAAQSHVREERRHARAAVGREGRARRAAARVALDRVGPGTAADAGAHGRVGPVVPGGVVPLGEGLLLRALHLKGQVGAVAEEPVVAVGARVGSLGDAAEAVEVELALEGRDLGLDGVGGVGGRGEDGMVRSRLAEVGCENERWKR